MFTLPSSRIFFSFLFAFSINSFLVAQTRFNIFAGPQVTTASYTVHGEKQNTQIKPGFQLGVGVKIEFENRLFFSPAIYYSLKGFKVTLDKPANPPDFSAINNNMNVHTLETAFLLQYDFNKNPSHFFIKLGPSLDFQIYGHEKFDCIDGTMISRKMNYGFENYGRYAASAVIQAGYELANTLFIYAYYEHGITNLSNADKGPTIQYRATGITIGKFFK